MTTARISGLVVGTMLAFTAAACGTSDGNDRVATAGGGTAPTSNGRTTPLDEQEQQRRFIQCLRDNGLEVPDQQGGGAVQLGDGSGGDAPPDQADAALGKCRDLLPSGGDAPRPSAEELAKLREHAQCMRDNGLTDFPDPDPDMGGVARAGGPDPLDPNDPRHRAAFEKCQNLLPNPDVSVQGPGK